MSLNTCLYTLNVVFQIEMGKIDLNVRNKRFCVHLRRHTSTQSAHTKQIVVYAVTVQEMMSQVRYCIHYYDDSN